MAPPNEQVLVIPLLRNQPSLSLNSLTIQNLQQWLTLPTEQFLGANINAKEVKMLLEINNQNLNYWHTNIFPQCSYALSLLHSLKLPFPSSKTSWQPNCKKYLWWLNNASNKRKNKIMGISLFL